MVRAAIAENDGALGRWKDPHAGDEFVAVEGQEGKSFGASAYEFFEERVAALRGLETDLLHGQEAAGQLRIYGPRPASQPTPWSHRPSVSRPRATFCGSSKATPGWPVWRYRLLR